MRWKYSLWCLDCNEKYDVFPQSVEVGPIGEYELFPGEVTNGIQTYGQAFSYEGRVLKICCPICTLRLFVAVDATDKELLDWLETQSSRIQYSNIFEKTSIGLAVKNFPVNCPRCEFSIDAESMRKSCKKCGSNNMNLVKSEPN